MKEQKIVIVDYGMGNPGSVRNMLRHIGVPSVISSKEEHVGHADKLVLSGVGAFDSAMRNLEGLGLLPVLNRRVLKDRIPVLGICLGMQLLTRGSEEGTLPGLGWIAGRTVKFRFDREGERLKVPHMGWNLVSPRKSNLLFVDMPKEIRFYFVHSYHVICDDEGDVLCTTHYGYDFCSAVERGNIFGTQFHPEKSHRFGIQFLKNFTERV